MNTQEPIPDPIVLDLSFLGNVPRCEKCKGVIVGNICYNDQRAALCFDCYCNYIKQKFGMGNTNPDDYRII